MDEDRVRKNSNRCEITSLGLTTNRQSLLDEIVEDIFFSIELSSTNHFQGLREEDFKSYISRNISDKINAAGGRGLLLRLEAAAKSRAKKWIAQRKEEEAANGAKEKLEKALHIMSDLHVELKTANKEEAELLPSIRKRKMREVERQLDEVTTTIKRMRTKRGSP